MNRRQFALASLLALASASEARADAAVRAVSGDAFIKDGVETRLIDILAPAIGAHAEPYGLESKAALDALLQLTPLSIEERAPPDRWGRKIARVSTGAGTSVQELLIKAGAARVRPESDDKAFITHLLTLEEKAREERLGLWRSAHYRVYDASDAKGAIGAFNLVEGVVVKARAVRGRVYLNFGSDYRTDFTATASTLSARKWKTEGLDLVSLVGATLRLRGYVAAINGPSIEVRNALQIEALKAMRD